MDPTIIVALITGGVTLLCHLVPAILKVVPANSENAVVPANSENADLSSLFLKLNETVQRRMDILDMGLESFEKRNNIIYSKERDIEKRANEAIITFGNNVQVTMFFHSLGSIYLQVNYPYVGVLVSVSMAVSFFFAFMVAFIVTYNKIEGMFHCAKDLQKMKGDLKDDVTCFGFKIESMAYNDQELRTLTSMGAHGEVWNRMDLLTRNAAALKKAIAERLELSNSKQMNSLSQIAVVASIYGLTFPMVAYYSLYFGLRKMGFISC